VSRGLVSVTWSPREPPLSPVAVAAQGVAAWRLARRVLEYSDEQLARLTGVPAAVGDRYADMSRIGR